jgi:CheY-like chemotaxis protein
VDQRTVQLAEANEGLQRASRLKDQFLAMLSHELRTPLTAIYGWVYLLQSKPLDKETVNKGLDVISRNVKAQTQLVDDLLNVSRIITGNLRIVPEWTSGVAAIHGALDSMKPAIQNKKLNIVEKLDASIDPIFVDPARLQQVLWNVLSNAVKFTPAGGSITVEFGRFKNNVRFSITDSGEGIEANFLPHVFDRFSQADTSTTRKHGGLGLGLSIVRHIVELHGGKATVYSEGKDKGSTFILDFPVGAMRPIASAQEAKAHERALSGLKIVLVEDDQDSREVIAETLANFGAVVVQAAHASEALTIIVQLDPDILISDIAMPQIDGYELVSRVKSRYPHLPAVALTAFATADDKKKALAAGFQAHVTKPVDALELVEVLAAVVQNRGH